MFSGDRIDEFLNQTLDDTSIVVDANKIKLTDPSNLELTVAALCQKVNGLEKSLQRSNEINNKLQDEVTMLRADSVECWKRVYDLEKDLSNHRQYNRRESVEILGIPESVKQSQLEETVIGILRRIGIQTLESYEVVACHRLRRKTGMNRNVIIRFVNRKRAHQCLQNRFMLKEMLKNLKNLFIV